LTYEISMSIDSVYLAYWLTKLKNERVEN